jgi:hypothetical protein
MAGFVNVEAGSCQYITISDEFVNGYSQREFPQKAGCGLHCAAHLDGFFGTTNRWFIMMNRGEVYKVMAALIEQYRSADFDQLATAAGAIISRDPIQFESAEIKLEIRTEWTDDSRRALRITITAEGPSCWMTDRVLESIIIRRPAE